MAYTGGMKEKIAGRKGLKRGKCKRKNKQEAMMDILVMGMGCWALEGRAGD